jgi:hypothetical protein
VCALEVSLDVPSTFLSLSLSSIIVQIIAGNSIGLLFHSPRNQNAISENPVDREYKKQLKEAKFKYPKDTPFPAQEKSYGIPWRTVPRF